MVIRTRVLFKSPYELELNSQMWTSNTVLIVVMLKISIQISQPDRKMELLLSHYKPFSMNMIARPKFKMTMTTAQVPVRKFSGCSRDFL